MPFIIGMSLPVKKTEATKIIILVFIVNKGHYLSQCGGLFISTLMVLTVFLCNNLINFISQPAQLPSFI